MLKMTCPKDQVFINGNMLVNTATSGSGKLTAGELFIKGDFLVDSEALQTEGTHRITMCGDKKQRLKMNASNQKIQNLILKNTSDEGIENMGPVYITGQILDECKVITGNGVIYVESLSGIQNGNLGGNVTITGKDVLMQDVEIGGQLRTYCAIDLNGHLLYAKKYLVENSCIINHGKLYVTDELNFVGNSRLYMTNPDDEVYVLGNMLMQSNLNHEGILTDGILEVCGDFTQKSNYINFVATGNHTTILGKKQTQTGENYIQKITFDQPGKARFHKLILKKVRQTGYVFSADVFSLADEVIEEATDEISPTQVSNLRVENVTPGSVTISYDASTDENGVAGYHIYRDGEKVGVSVETTFTDIGLLPAQTYRYTVYALDHSRNQSTISEELTVITGEDQKSPTQVTGITVERVTGSKVCLKWDASTDDGKIQGYHIYRDGIRIAENVEQTCFEDRTIEAMVPYVYTVTAVDSCQNESDRSESVTAVGYLPQVVKVSPADYSSIGGDEVMLKVYFKDFGNSTGNTVTIDWQVRGSNEWNSLCPYPLGQEKTDRETLEASVVWNLSSYEGRKDIDVRYTITDEDGNATEHFVTYDMDKNGALPPEMIKTEDQGGSVLVSWSASRSSDCAGYIIYRNKNNTYWEKLCNIREAQTLAWADQTAASGIRYAYRVSAYDAFGQEGKTSPSSEIVAGKDTMAPIITGISPEDTKISKVTKFTLSGEDNYNVKRLRLYIRPDNDTQKTLLHTSLPEKQKAQMEYALDTTKYEDGIYVIYGEAIDEAGNISQEYRRYYEIDNTGIGKMSFAKCTATSTAIRLNWLDVREEDFSYFAVEQKRENVFKEIGKVSDSLSYTIDSLLPETEYTFRVLAYDKAGNRGVESDEITLKTTLDTIRPRIARIQPGEGSFKDKIPLMIRVDDNHDIERMVISWKSNNSEYVVLKEFESKTDEKKEEFAYDWDISSVPEGKVEVKFEAYDTSGNHNELYEEKEVTASYLVDRTPPAQVRNVLAEDERGAVKLTWKGSSENNVTYRIYRAQEDGFFRMLCDNCASNEYRDYKVEPLKSYLYYVTAVDVAGNEGEASAYAEVLCQPDTSAPKITGVTSVSGNCIGKNTPIEVLALDNAMMSHIRLEYKEKGSEENYIRMESATPDGCSCYAEFSMAQEKLKEEVWYEFRFTAVDKAGNVSPCLTRYYKFDLTAPEQPELTAKSESFHVKLSWTENKELDFSYYKLYRRRYNSKDEECILTTKATSFEDRTAVPDLIYYYRVEAYDMVGNFVSGKEKYSYANTIDTEAPTAILPEFQMQEFGREMSFDGTGSYDNVRIVSYVWNFGDDTFGSGAKPSHYYEQAGEYDVKLTVYDAMGNFSVAHMIARVIDLSAGGNRYHTTIHVTDPEGRPIRSADVYIKNLNETTSEAVNLSTDSNGETIFIGNSSYYQIAAFKQGYIPNEQIVLLMEEQENDIHIVLSEGNVVVGNINTYRMELPELIEAGVDLSDPANYYTYRCELVLIFESRPLPVVSKMLIPAKASHATTPPGKGRHIVNTPFEIDGGEGELIVEDGVMVATVMTVEAGVSWLKEMYCVNLDVINCSQGSFTLENGNAILNVPEGMSFVPAENSRSIQQNVDTLYAGQSRRVGWIVRGDKPGKYKIGAQFSGSLMPFDKMVFAEFETEKDVEVTAGEGLHLQFEVEDAAYNHHDYYIYATLENTSEHPFYNVTLALGNQKVQSPEFTFGSGNEDSEHVFEMEYNEETGILGGTVVIDGSGITVNEDINPDEFGDEVPEEIKLYLTAMKTKRTSTVKEDSESENVCVMLPPAPIKADSSGVEPDPWERYVVKTRYGYEKLYGGISAGGTGNDSDGEDQSPSSPALSGMFGDSKSITISALYPGECVNLLLKTFPQVALPENQYLKLVDSFVNVLEGENLGVDVSINVKKSRVPTPTIRGETAGIIYTTNYGDPVSTVNGAFIQELDTLTVKSADELSLRLFYNSLTAEDVGEAGRGFSHSYEQYIVDYGTWITLRDGKANETKYVPKDSPKEEKEEGDKSEHVIVYQPDSDKMEGTTIERKENGYVLLSEDGTKITFDKFGFLTGMSGPEGRHISVTWDENDMILTEDLSGEMLRLSYNETGHLCKVSDNHDREVLLAYDDDNCLTSLTDVLGKVTKFEYDSRNHMKKVMNAAGETTVSNNYDEYGRVVA